MKSRLHILLRALAAFVVLTASATASGVQFRILGWSAQDLNLRFDAGQKPVETYIPTENLSPVYEFKGEGSIVFYKQVRHEDQIIRQTACTVVIPPGLKQGILLLLPGDDSKVLSRKVVADSQGFVSSNAPLTYTYVWLDDSLEARPAGTIEFRNLSRRPVAFQIGETRLTLDPQAKTQVPLVSGAKRMSFRAAAHIDGNWKMFSSNPLPTRGPVRMLVLLRDAPRPEPSVQVVPLYDWPAPPAQPATLASTR